jgi:hypothetical protein
MQYSCKFYHNGEPYENHWFDDKDEKRSVSFCIVRAINALNYKIINESNVQAALQGAMTSIMSDSRKSKALALSLNNFMSTDAML